MRKLSGAASLAVATATLVLVVPAGISAAQVVAPQPNLKTLVAQAKQLESQINSLSEQYDGLRIQLNQAQANAKIAQQAASRGQAALSVGQQAIAQLAAANYINSGLDPTFAALTSGDPAQFLSQASAIAEINQSSGVKVNALSNKVTQALRDKETADQQAAAVRAIETQMDAKKKVIEGKIDKVNSAAMAQAMQVFRQTGSYPDITIPTENTVDGQALQEALTRRGDPYVWAAAGPSQFDCSGLVVWAFAQEGISLPHYTGDLWNSGMHIARADLEPGDLVFFGADISHVGFYVGDGMMLDAPDTGDVVRIQPLFSDYVGAVRIA
ncbi:MAG: NlpC/P60 family protein [Streptosporangiaceae bacterium]